jgi:hypothetical protein
MVPLYYFLMLFYPKFSKGYNRNVYRIAILILKYPDTEEFYGLCFLMLVIADCYDIYKFKELNDQKPILSNRCRPYWYPKNKEGSLLRIKALEEAIKLTYKK